MRWSLSLFCCLPDVTTRREQRRTRSASRARILDGKCRRDGRLGLGWLRRRQADDAGTGSGSSTYTPAEFKSGMSKWRDVGVYVDGQPVGFLTFGELPIALKPVLVEDEVR